VALDSEQLDGPFWGRKDAATCKKDQREPHVDEKLLKVAEVSNLSIDTVNKLYHFVHNRQSRSFIPQELANFLNIGKRSADRLLERLEHTGYATIIGRRMNKGSGRPTRIMQIDLNSERGFKECE
jgi:predicted ArsR family transcriptional regulator